MVAEIILCGRDVDGCSAIVPTIFQQGCAVFAATSMAFGLLWGILFVNSIAIRLAAR